MKQLFLLFAITLSLSIKAQITLDHVQQTEFQKFTTTSLGDKYYTYGGNPGDTVSIYNTDWSIYRQIKLPLYYSYMSLGISTEMGGNNSGFNIPSFSDKLFNSDTLIEFLVYRQQTPSSSDTLSIMNELGQIVYSFPDTGIASAGLMNVEGNFKIYYETGYNIHSYNFVNVKTYSLPGSLPCNQCSFPTGIVEPNQGGALAGLAAYPNPFNSTLSIEYNLLSAQDGKLILTTIDGKELRSIHLSNQSDKLVLSTSDLPQGMIIASLYGANQHLISKKLLKIE